MWRIVLAVGLSIVGAIGCGGGGSSASCGVSRPWVEVVNKEKTALDAMWDGGKVTVIPADSTRFVDNTGIKSAPPYHLVLRDHETGAKVGELTMTVDSGPEAVTFTESGSSVSPTTPPTTPGTC